MKNPLELINRPTWIKILWSVALLLLVAVLGTLLVLNIPRGMDSQSQDEMQNQLRLSEREFDMDDFYLADRNDLLTYPLYQRQRYWSDDDVQSYWIDPGSIGLDTLPERNDQLIYDSLGIEH